MLAHQGGRRSTQSPAQTTEAYSHLLKAGRLRSGCAQGLASPEASLPRLLASPGSDPRERKMGTAVHLVA